MDKLIILNVRKLVDYINDSDLELIPPRDCSYKGHIGALFTDIILQSGVSYKGVVAPRVGHVLETYPEAFSIKRFLVVIKRDGIENVLLWKHPIKLQRMQDLLEFCFINNINYTEDIKDFLRCSENRKSFLEINGIGNKTLDYLLKLLDIETIAVDRHIFSFVEKAGIDSKDYHLVKMIVEYAADIMNISRRTIDYSIWSHMSNISINKQLSLSFE